MKELVFAENRADFFQSHNLRSFDDFFCYGEGTQINKNARRNVLVMTFPDESAGDVFYMKRFFNPHLKDMFFALRNYHTPASQGQLEWNNANYLLRRGIGTYQPVCFGHCKLCGIEMQSFFLTDKLQMPSLVDFVRRFWQNMPDDKKRRMITSLADFVRRIHDHRVSLPDLYAYHLFVRADGLCENFEFSVIDLHRMRINVPPRRMNSLRVENLARLDFSMPDEYFDASLKDLLLEKYLSSNPPMTKDRLKAKIQRRVRQLLLRRRPPVYQTNENAGQRG